MNAVALVEQPVGNIEAEAALIAALITSNQLIDPCADVVRPEDFTDEFFGFVFSLIVREAGLAKLVSPVTLRPFLDAEGFAVLADLSGSAYAGVAAIGAVGFARQIAEYARRRELIDKLGEAMAAARRFDSPVDELVATVEVALAEATRTNDGIHEPSGAQCIGEALAAIERADPGIVSGIAALDEALGPIRPKNLVIVAGRPGMGKTAVALSYGIGAARSGHGVLFVSLEMSSEELGERMACDIAYDDRRGTGVPYAAVVSGKVDTGQMGALMDAQQAMHELPFQVVDIGSVQVGRLATMVRRWKRRFAARGQSLDLVIVDYLQLVRPDVRVSSRYEAITEVSMALKAMAKTHEVGVIAVAQLSRKVEERPDKRPMLADLRDSGQIEQDADAILFLLRDEYYLRKSEPDQLNPARAAWEHELARIAGRIDFICAKRRKGRERTTQGYFHGAYQAVRG